MGVTGAGVAATARAPSREGHGRCDLVGGAEGTAACRVTVPTGARGDILGAHAHSTGRSVCVPRGEAVEHPVRTALTGVVPPHTAPRVGHLLAPPAALHTRPTLAADVRGERGGRPGRGVGGVTPPRKPTGGPDFHGREARFSARGAGGVKAGRAGYGPAHVPPLAPREEGCTRATG